MVMELFRRSWGSPAARSVPIGVPPQQASDARRCCNSTRSEAGRSAGAPLRRASPAQRSYMMALRKRCRQKAPSSLLSAPVVGAGNASTAVHTSPVSLHVSVDTHASHVSKASRALASSRRPPAFSPEWTPTSTQLSITSSLLTVQADAGQLQPTAPPPSELQSLGPATNSTQRTASAPELQVSPTGATKRKRTGTPDSSSSDRTQPRLVDSGDNVAVVDNNGLVEVWDGDDWGNKHRLAVLHEQLAEERAARMEAERQVRELEQNLQVASDETTRHLIATVKRLEKDNQMLLQKVEATASR